MRPGTSVDAAQAGGVATRLGFVLGLVALGALLSLSATRERPERSERVGRRLELVELVAQQQRRTEELSAQVATLEREIAGLQAAFAETPGDVAALEEQARLLAVDAGLAPLRGPGVTVTMRDSSLPLSGAVDVNDLVIHEQDLQAVVNAVWHGGAEAVAVNGQRILATSAVRCVGNILLLNGQVHPPPYVVSAIGDPVGLATALDRDPSVQLFRAAAETFDLGYEVTSSEVEVPAFDGPPPVEMAMPEAA